MENKNNPKQTVLHKRKTESSVEELKYIEYPVQQVGDEAPNKKDVKNAVKELNPDPNSLGSRG